MNIKTTNDHIKREDNLSSGSLENSIILRFEQMVDLYPGNIAVKDHDQTLSYRALNKTANRLAQIVLENSREDDLAPVAFLLDTNIPSIVTLLAILKAGRPFLALHTANPVERLKALISSAGSTCLISTRQYQNVVEEISADGLSIRVLYMEDIDLTIEAANPRVYVSQDALFSIFYTSGSTGEPKGSVISHEVMLYWTMPFIHQWQLTPDDRMSLFTSISFGISVFVILAALLSGGTVCILDLKTHSSEKLTDWIRSERISILRLTPSVLRTIFDPAPEGSIFPDLRIITVAGEAAKRNDVALFKAHTGEDCKLFNIYAQTETGVLAFHSIGHETPLPDGDLPAGHPFPGYEITLLNDAGEPVGAGEAGEIVAKSRYLSRGYWRQPELTAEKFLAVPGEPDVKIFHTGDLGRWRSDGMLEHLGRVDTQVKIRGQRVEISEVESTLRQNPAVKDVVVVARPSKHQPDQLQLIAYVIPQLDHTTTGAALREYLSSKLPDYSIPSFIFMLDQFPLNATGKVDRQALPDLPEREDLVQDDLPADPVEEKLVAIWSDLLKLDKLSVHDNFFELGGDSLLVLSMTLEVEKALSYKVPQAFFKDPTIRNLAHCLGDQKTAEADPSDTFVLRGHRRAGWRSQLVALLNIFRERRRAFDEVFIFEWILFRFVQGMSLRKVMELVYRMADQPILLKTVYAAKYQLFRRLLESVGVSSKNSMHLFRQNFIDNYMFKLLEARRPFSMPKNQRANPRSVYFRDRKQFIDSLPDGQLDEFFPVEGFKYLEDAYRQGRGVILLSFHGSGANNVAHRFLARRLGGPPFQAIAHNLARHQSSLGTSAMRILKTAPTVEASVYAELAYYGQRLLQQGRVIMIAPDLAKDTSRMYTIPVGDRVDTIKAGFAQLALNTGASIIPVYGRYVEHGRLLTSLQPPLNPGTGSREEQIQALIRQYGDFTNAAIKLHPEMLTWQKMKNHLRLPKATASRGGKKPMNIKTTNKHIKRVDNLTSGSLESLEKSIILRFEQIVNLYPENTAVKDQDQTLSYRTLNAMANRLAQIVLEQGKGDEYAPVGILLDTNVPSIVTMLAVLKAGRPFLALHPSSPVDRLKAVISSAGTTCLISTRQYQSLIEEIVTAGPAVLYLEDMDLTASAANPGIYVSHEAPFSIIYTSGSTGEPKGIAHNHGRMIFWISRHIDHWRLSSNDRLPLFTSNSFGASLPVILDGLLSGGTVCLLDLKNHSSEKLLDWIRTERISILRLTPSVLRTIFEQAPEGEILSDLRVITLTGEAVKRNDVALFMAHTGEDCILVNTYAQTEAGVLADHTIGHQTPIPDEDLPVGDPISGYEITLLNEEGQPVERGEAGEIVVKSRYLSMGYWRQPDLTAQKFRAVPGEPDVKIFHTGDLGRWRSDGLLEHLGRMDFQVKIRGQRVELSEVETFLRQNPAVKDAVVVARPAKYQPDQIQLIAYVVRQPGRSASASNLRTSLATKLPDYSIPSFFVFLDRFPLNPNGKVDRQALPDLPERAAPSTSDLPADEIEEQLVAIWSGLLNIDNIGVNDDFFEVGGDSLLVLSMTLEVEKTLSHKIPQSFFEDPTIRKLAQSLRDQDPDQQGTEAGFVLQGHRSHQADLPFAQRTYSISLMRRIRYHASELRRTVDKDFIFEWILFRFVQGMSFRKVMELVYRMADQPILLKTLYSAKYRLFCRWLESMGVSSQNSMPLFRQNFIDNYMFRLLEARHPFSMPKNQRTSPRSAYFRDRKQFIESLPDDQLDEFFPVEGYNYIEDAYRQKRGVILLSFHGTAANSVAYQFLARRLGSRPFQVIAKNSATLQSTLWNSWERNEESSSSVEASVYAELAYYAQKLLNQGKVIMIAADLAKVSGRMYPIQIGDRVYQIMAGFAQLALNTGASVIPVYGRYVEHGRLLTSLQPPLDPGTGNREVQIQAFIRQYADFVTSTFKLHPEMLTWKKIGQHLRLPRS